MRVAIVAAVALLALACGNKKEKAPATTGSAAGSAPSAGSDVAGSAAVGSAAVGSGEGVACSDDDIKKHVDAGLAASNVYLGLLERRVGRWKKDCEEAKQDLLNLEPAATTFVDAMMSFKTWGEKLTPDCRKRVEEVGEKHAITADIDKRTPVIEERLKPMFERCKDHPGFQEAAAKGLRVMRRRQPAQ